MNVALLYKHTLDLNGLSRQSDSNFFYNFKLHTYATGFLFSIGIHQKIKKSSITNSQIVSCYDMQRKAHRNNNS